VIVVGGGLIGAETAWFLAEQGKQVTVTTRQQIVGYDLLATARIVLADAYRKNGVRSINNVKLDEITEKGAVFIDRNWERQHLEAETLVLASGMTSRTELADDPAVADRDLHVIGDARQPSNIGSAILAGAYLARLV
jgi:pyruvate/2-oxoglutarate dehydrogenase complex dihydrolipoamide dehydrogenase (E3) component